MNVDAAVIVTLIGFLGMSVAGLIGYIRSQNNELKAMLKKSLDDCEAGRLECEKRSKSQQAQIDALIDGDNDLAKSKRDTDTVPVVHQPAVIFDPTPLKRKLLGLLLVIISLFLVGCSMPTPELAQSVKAEIEKRQAAEVERDAAIHTSMDARAAADHSRDEARTLRALADEKDSEAKRLDAAAKRLRNQEISDRIAVASWWLIGAGVIATGVALFMALRFGGRTAWTGVIAGGGTVALGFVGLALAPWWLPMAWVIGVLAVGAAVVLLVRTLLQHRVAAESMAHQWQTYADALGNRLPDVRASLDSLSREEQPSSVRGLISHLLDRTKLPDVTARSAGV